MIISSSIRAVVNRYTVNINTNNSVANNVRLFDETGAVIESGSKYNYGTPIYISGIMPSNTAQYVYSNMTCKCNDNVVNDGRIITLTEDMNIELSCIRSNVAWTVSIFQSPGATITVECGDSSYTSSFVADYGVPWTATVSYQSGYKPGELAAMSGTVDANTVIKFVKPPQK